jgi:hypothetical protein
MRSARGENPVAVYTLRIKRSKLDRFREIAAEQHRTVAGELNAMIDERLAAEPSDDHDKAAA